MNSPANGTDQPEEGRMTDQDIVDKIKRGPVEKYGTVGAGGLLSILIYMVLTAQADLENKVEQRAVRTDSSIERLTENVNLLTIQLTKVTSGTQPADVKARVERLSEEILKRDDVLSLIQASAPWKEDKQLIEERLRDIEKSIMRMELMLDKKPEGG